jgi:hypothetical protein
LIVLVFAGLGISIYQFFFSHTAVEKQRMLKKRLKARQRILKLQLQHRLLKKNQLKLLRIVRLKLLKPRLSQKRPTLQQIIPFRAVIPGVQSLILTV